MGKDPELIKLEKMLTENSIGTARVSVNGCFNRGMQYHNGDGVPQDFDKAVEFYQMAAERGHIESMYCLGIIYSDDEFEEKKDAEMALKYFIKAAEHGHEEACDELEYFASCFLGENTIHNVKVDEKKAIAIYKILDEIGSGVSQYKLGECYEKGIDVLINREKAFELYEKAAICGHAEAKKKISNENIKRYINNGIVYTLIENCAVYEITEAALNLKGKIIIPAECNDIPVVAIGEKAFALCSEITSVIIPDSVIKIGDSAFACCSNLMSVAIPYSVTSIGGSAFERCENLISISIPNSVTEIGAYAFSNCIALSSIYIPESVNKIGSGTFADCCSLKNIIVDSSNLNYSCFGGILYNKKKTEIIAAPCNNINGQITIGDTIISIADNAFVGCSSLTSLTIPASVISIGGSAFYGCDNLESVIIPSSVINIGSSAFHSCDKLISVEIPNSIKQLKKMIFSDCTRLSSILLPNSITEIEDTAFSRCNSLRTINIPNSVKNIGCFAFIDCEELTSITVSSDNLYYSSVDGILYDKFKTKIIAVPNGITGSIAIPNTVESIDEVNFVDCTKLTSVIIPNSVKTIGNLAFQNCIALSTVTIPNSVETIGYGAFENCNNITINVVGRLSLPKGWSSNLNSSNCIISWNFIP